MILVTIGTSDPFDRLLRAVERLPPGEDVVAQCGDSAVRPRNARCVDFLPFDSLAELTAAARVVVTHAGAGSILTALAAGKHPIAVPRLRAHGEAIDDHQVEFGRRLRDADLLTLVEDLERLPEVVAGAPRGGARRAADGLLARDLRTYLLSRARDARAGVPAR